MRSLCVMLIVVFFLSVPACRESQQETAPVTDEKVSEKKEQPPKLSDEDRDKLQSLGYVE